MSSRKLKTNTIAQFILELQLINHFASFWAFPDVPDHIHLEWLVTLFYAFLITCENSTAWLRSFQRYCSFKNSVFWLVGRFLSQNSTKRIISIHSICDEKSQTSEEGGVYHRIFIKNFLLKKLLKWANKKYKYFNIYKNF